MTSRSLKSVLETHTPKLMKILGVVGIAQSEEDGTPVILVFVNKMDERIRRDVPSTLEGYPVRVHEAGDVRPTR